MTGRRAQAETQRHLAAAPGRARRQQSAEVDAGDQQQHDRPGEEQRRDEPAASQDVVTQRRERRHLIPRDNAGPLQLQPRYDAVELGGRLLPRHARAQAPDHLQEHGAVVRQPRPRAERREDVHAAGKDEPGRQHADHREVDAGQGQAGPHDAGVGAEDVHPERVGEDDRRPGSLPVVRRPEGAAEEGPHPEGAEELAGDARALDGDRIAAAGQDVAVPVDGGRQGGQALEARRLRLPLQELRVGELDHARRIGPAGLPARYEALLLRKREGLEHDGVQDAEHRRACADAHGQRRDGEHRHARAPVLELPAQGVANLAPRFLEPPVAAGVAAQLLDLVEAAELEARAPAGLPGRQPGPQVVGHLSLDVVAELGVELVFCPVTAPQPLQRWPPAHRAPPPAVPRIRPTASASRAQLSVCSCNWAWPLGVSR